MRRFLKKKWNLYACRNKIRRELFYVIYFGKGENTLVSNVVGKRY